VAKSRSGTVTKRNRKKGRKERGRSFSWFNWKENKEGETKRGA